MVLVKWYYYDKLRSTPRRVARSNKGFPVSKETKKKIESLLSNCRTKEAKGTKGARTSSGKCY